MTKFLAKKITVFTVVTLIAAIFVGAFGATAAPLGDGETYEFKMSSDHMSITCGDDIYYLYSMPGRYKLDTDYVLVYSGYVSVGNQEMRVCSYELGGEIIWLGDYTNPSLIYATEEGQNILNGLFNGVGLGYTLDIDFGGASYFSTINKALVDSLNNLSSGGADTKVTPASLLRFYDCYTVVAHDSIDIFARDLGAIYDIDGELYYIDYSKLGNHYFDYSGNFTYGYGDIELVKLENDALKGVKDALNSKRPSYGGIEVDFYEGHQISHGGVEYGDSTGAMVAFWIMYALAGFAMPAAFAIVSGVVANKAKLGRPRYWYVGSVIGGIWIIIAVILMMVLIL